MRRWFGSVAAITLVVACEGSTPNNELLVEPDPGPATPASDAAAPITDGGAVISADGAAVVSYPAWDDPTALKWIVDKCASCHGVDETGKKALYYSAWPMARVVTRESLEISDYTPAAYQTVVHRLVNVKGPPSPMPVAAPNGDKEVSDLHSALDWFNRRLPFSVLDAEKRYGTSSTQQKIIAAGFRCDKTLTLRRFLQDVTLGAFDRVADTKELGYFTVAELDAPVTLPQREHIAAWLENGTPGALPAWKSEVLDVALKKIATVIGGAPLIQPLYGLSPAEAAALKEEFYQQLRAHYDDWNYDQFFTANEVMVNSVTAAGYGCTPPASGWQVCALAPPRKTFFTTRGYLNSKVSSFMLENNNYGRVARMFFTLYGEALLAATDGPTGDTIPPLPSCLEGVDTRTYNAAPRGSATVPLYGSVCQGCHVARGLAAGSILFRPFARNGAIYSNLGAVGSPDKDLYDNDLKADTLWKYTPAGQTVPVALTGATGQVFLSTLLASASAPQSCVASGNPTTPYVAVNDVSGLVAEFLKHESAVARGFTRHAQRALMNQIGVTLELGLRATESYEQGKRRIPDLLKAYFLADTLTCEP